MKTTWRIPPWSGAAIGIVAAVSITWMTREGWQALLSIVQQGGSNVTGPGWMLVALGVLLGLVVVAAALHPLISAVPAIWFLALFGPSLVGMFPTPGWYPEWVASYVSQALSPAPYIVTGVLVLATIAPFVRTRSPVPTRQPEPDSVS